MFGKCACSSASANTSRPGNAPLIEDSYHASVLARGLVGDRRVRPFDSDSCVYIALARVSRIQIVDVDDVAFVTGVVRPRAHNGGIDLANECRVCGGVCT